MVDCGICLEKDAEYSIPSCGHEFHQRCLAESVESGIGSCPFCRRRFTFCHLYDLWQVGRHVKWHRVRRGVWMNEGMNEYPPELREWMKSICDEMLARYCSEGENCQYETEDVWSRERIWNFFREYHRKQERLRGLDDERMINIIRAYLEVVKNE